jgi:hypothetical protein
MVWEKPEVVEIKMDAEVGSYQLDDEPLFVEREELEAAE